MDCEWGSYSEWSSCTVSCGGGEKSRTRPVATAASNGGKDCEGEATESEACNTEGCPVNCQWGSYGDWSSCSVSCGGGEKSRTRPVATAASNGGQDCEGDATESKACNTGGCPVNCQWGSYGNWSSCSVSCGRGEKSRRRPVAIAASNGGQACTGNATEIMVCDEIACPGNVD